MSCFLWLLQRFPTIFFSLLSPFIHIPDRKTKLINLSNSYLFIAIKKFELYFSPSFDYYAEW